MFRANALDRDDPHEATGASLCPSAVGTRTSAVGTGAIRAGQRPSIRSLRWRLVDRNRDGNNPATPATAGAPGISVRLRSGQPVGRPATTLRRTLPGAWTLIGPYWFSEDRWAGRGLLLAVILLTLGMVYLTVLLNQWNNAFYSALQDKNLVAFRHQLLRVTWLIGIFIVLAVHQVYLNQMLEIRWRRWLMDRYLRGWLAGGAYYRMQLVERETDNPDQRIAEDTHLLASHTLGLFTGGLRAIVTLVTFVAILWGLSGTVTVPVGGLSIRVPGYMVWVAVLYAIAGTWITDWIGRPLVRLNFDRQRYEANFRFSLARFRENTEGVALYRGEADELRGFRQRFEDVVSNWWGIMRRQKRMTYFTSGYGLGAWIVPSFVAAPRFFRGELGLGGLMQTSQAFQQVQDALSFFVRRTRRSQPGARWSSASSTSSARSIACGGRRPLLGASAASRAAPPA